MPLSVQGAPCSQIPTALRGGSAGSSHRAVSCLPVLRKMAEEEGLNTESAEEQSGVSPSCQQGNNVLGSSVATHITPTLSHQAISQVRVTLSLLSELG